jgi:Flp pilus assembly protein TadD
MRKWSLITALVLALSAWVVGQSTSQQPDAQQQKEPTAAGQHAQTLEGCITKAATGFTLTDNSGKTYQLAGDPSQLAAEDGHWDKVTGTAQSDAAAAAGTPATFTVTKVRVVKTTCPNK